MIQLQIEQSMQYDIIAYCLRHNRKEAYNRLIEVGQVLHKGVSIILIKQAATNVIKYWSN
jgi:hypothetical protein